MSNKALNAYIGEQEAHGVEWYLDNVDYSFKGYIPSKEALLFVNFIKEVNDGKEENETPIVHLVMMDSVFNKEEMCAIMVYRGAGKLEAKGNKILTPSGWVTMENLKVGDSVFNRNGEEVSIRYKTPKQMPDMYEVTFSNGTKIKFGDEHRHIVVNSRGNEKVVTTTEMYEKGVSYDNYKRGDNQSPKAMYRYRVPLCKPIQHKEKVLELDPYLMGYMLGDGYFKGKTITVEGKDLSNIKDHVLGLGYSIWEQEVPDSNTVRFRITGLKTSMTCTRKDKYVPHEYLFGSVEQRVSILRGLMDSDGTIGSNGSCRFSNNSMHLIEGVKELVESLGGIATVQHTRKKEGCDDNYTLRVKISSYNPFKLPRKADKWKPANIKTNVIVGIQPIAKEEGYCIAVDCPTESYITKNYIVTHNTTVFAEYLILFIAAFGYMPSFGKVDYILYVTDSIENGVRNLRRNVEFRYNNSEFLQKLIPNQRIQVISEDDVEYSLGEMKSAAKAGVRFTDVRLELMNYKGNKVIVRGYGVSTGVRGTKEDGKRPTLAILDDLMSDVDAKSPTIIGNINDIIYKAVDKALHPTNRKIIYLGTPFNAKDPLYVAIESGAWKASVFPVCERFPVPEKEFVGAWEDRFTYKAIKKSHKTAVSVGHVSAFYQEMMLRIHSEEDTLIRTGSILKANYDEEMATKESAKFYITTDFATSEKESADFSTMCVWKHDKEDNLTIMEGYCKKSRMEQNIDVLFDLIQKYKPKLVGIEVSGQQGGFIDWIQAERRRRGVHFVLAKQKGREHTTDLGIRPNKNKILRLQAIVPLFNRGQIAICNEVLSSPYGKELFEELDLATTRGFMSKHDDATDAMTQLMDINIFKPSGVVEEVEVKPKNKFDIIFSDENFKPQETVESSYVV